MTTQTPKTSSYISSACALSIEFKLTQTFDKLNAKDEPK